MLDENPSHSQRAAPAPGQDRAASTTGTASVCGSLGGQVAEAPAVLSVSSVMCHNSMRRIERHGDQPVPMV